MELLLNTIMLSVPISGSHSDNFLSFSHGEYFYSLFQTTINTELMRSLGTTVPCLMKASSQNPTMVIQRVKNAAVKEYFSVCGAVTSCGNPHQVSLLLNGMLDHSFRERSVRKTQGKQLVEEVLKGWISLQSWWEGNTSTPESKTATLLLLSKLLQVFKSD